MRTILEQYEADENGKIICPECLEDITVFLATDWRDAAMVEAGECPYCSCDAEDTWSDYDERSKCRTCPSPCEGKRREREEEGRGDYERDRELEREFMMAR